MDTVAETAPAADAPALNYTVAEDKSDGDTIRQRIIVREPVTHEALDALLRRMIPASQRGTVWAYQDQAHVDEGGSWLGMILNTDAGGTPEVTIEDSRIAALTAPKEEKFGLSEDQRHAIFDETVAVEDRAQHEADAKYPTDIDKVSVDEARVNGPLNADYSSTLTDKYHAELAKKSGITTDQLTKIAVEAERKNWAIAPPAP